MIKFKITNSKQLAKYNVQGLYVIFCNIFRQVTEKYLA